MRMSMFISTEMIGVCHDCRGMGDKVKVHTKTRRRKEIGMGMFIGKKNNKCTCQRIRSKFIPKPEFLISMRIQTRQK